MRWTSGGDRVEVVRLSDQIDLIDKKASARMREEGGVGGDWGLVSATLLRDIRVRAMQDPHFRPHVAEFERAVWNDKMI